MLQPSSLFFWMSVASALVNTLGASAKAASPDAKAMFVPEKLVAWCIVPFDARQRGPRERAEMVKGLGMRRVAYDWRAKHVPTFEQEIQEYKRNGIEFFAFWSWHDSVESLIRKHQIHPQIWLMIPVDGQTDAERIRKAAGSLQPMVEKTRELGVSLGLYNHGGWGGQPDNMVAVCKYLREHQGADHVGIVYNFHHGHNHIDGFDAMFRRMQPYLLCVNLNGMDDASTVNSGKNKILPIGDGKHERAMLHSVVQSGYRGPFGILDHRSEMDSEKALDLNLKGLDQLVKQLD